MAIVIRRKDYLIEIGTEDELRQVLRALEGTPQQLPLLTATPIRRGRKTRTEKAVKLIDYGAGSDTFVQLYKSIDPATQPRISTLIRELAHNPNGLTDSELRERLALSDNYMLAGVLSGFVKNAKRVGLPSDAVLIKQAFGPPGQRTHKYKLSASMIEAVNKNGTNIESAGGNRAPS